MYDLTNSDYSHPVLLKCIYKHAFSLYKYKHYKQSIEIIDQIPQDILTDEFIKLKEDNTKELNSKDIEWITKYDKKYDKLVKEVNSIDLDN